MKRILFFFVHPAKYHLFKYTINELKRRGHQVDIIITTKDVLEDLVKQEGWPYTNLFPEGRRSKSTGSLAILWATFINLFKTIYRLQRYLRGKKYDLFVTDDCLVFNGVLKGIPSIFFNDNELTTHPESALFFMAATKILCPVSVDIGSFKKKQIAFRGYKELAYLRPEYFVPDPSIPKKYNLPLENYFIIRLVSFSASHDRNKQGISDERLTRLIELLKNKGEVYICSERPLTEQFEKYRMVINPMDILQVLYFSKMFIGDSGTMTSEACLLGVPSIRCNDFVGRDFVIGEKETLYHLTYGFKPVDFDKMMDKINELLAMPNLRQEWEKRRKKMLQETDDLTELMINLFENFPAYNGTRN